MEHEHSAIEKGLVSPGEETGAGWRKWDQNPVLGGSLGTCFDLCLLKEHGLYRMWFSWRPQKSIALVESSDGIHWSDPVIVLGPNSSSRWEDDINRPGVLKLGETYHMWYTGQFVSSTGQGQSWIGHAVSGDGVTWERSSSEPVLVPDQPWEKVAVMCPHVLWDEATGLFKMWYSGGEQYEPDALGYATSRDGQHWTKHEVNPIFRSDPYYAWEQHKVTAAQIVPYGGWYLMFYIGFRDIHHAQIGLARSRDGITGWQRHSANPIIQPASSEHAWDHDAVYKPYALHENGRWLLWYNGRNKTYEQIGLALHDGDDLRFAAAATPID